MKILCKHLITFILLTGTFSLSGCTKEEPNILTVSPYKVEFAADGGSKTIIIQTDADSWSINNPASEWLVLSGTSGLEKTATVTLSVNTKTTGLRIDTLTITAGDAKPVKLVVKQLAGEGIYTLTADQSNLSFIQSGNSVNLTINTDAPQWNLTSNADWLMLSQTTGNTGTSVVKITALQNMATDARSAIIILSADNAKTIQLKATQDGAGIYPGYNTSPIDPDATGMNSNATELAAKIKLGWNIGNTLEAIGGETAWGNPRVTKELIKLVKQNGFNAIRIPCSFNQYMEDSTTALLKASWLDRVKEVVQLCVDEDMYVLLNIHWDGGWLENNCTEEKQEENNAKQKAFWEQIATHLRDYDEHLLFASANEPNVENVTQMDVLNSYHQTFVNAVRATGGKNSYRVLVVQGPSTDIEKTSKLMKSLPTDWVTNKLMAEIHYYTPYQFCLMTEDANWGKMFYYWGKDYHSATDVAHNPTWGEESTVDSFFKMMKTQFVDKGIPVVMGEYGSMLRTNLTGEALKLHKDSRAYYFYYVTKQAKANGILPFFWDTGGDGSLFNRKNNTVMEQQALDAVIKGATE